MHSSLESQIECIFSLLYEEAFNHCVVYSRLCIHLWMLLYEQPYMHLVYIHVVGEKVHYSGFCCKCASVKILLYILWRKTLEWNFFVSSVTSFPSLSFCSCVPKHDALFIYFLTQIQLVVFEKFIRQRELCAMIPQERNFLCILSLENILLYFRCRQNLSIQSCQVTVLSWLTHILCMYMK